MIGNKLGTYEIREEIGRGGMAIVYRAYQPTVDRQVAIKVIQKSILNDANALQRFQLEARLIARLEHPHILPIYDFDGAHDPPYIVMRYLESGTLKEVLRQGSLPFSDVFYLLRQVAAALDYAHRQNIVHRDIKPSNIMIDREGNAFVSDLGIARLTIGDGTHITEAGAIVGTPDYMAPEQAMGTSVINRHTDIYSLGVMFFQMITGRLPYTSPVSTGVLVMHVTEPIPLPSDFNPELPLAIDAVIQRVLAKNPADRYDTATDFVNAAAEAMGGSTAATPLVLQNAALESIMLRQTRVGNDYQETSSDSDSTPAEQQKQLTIVYINMGDLMELVDREASSDAVPLRNLMGWLVDGVVAEHGGRVQSRSGDVLLALWGITAVHEDDAEQAVRAALSIQQTISDIAAESLSRTYDPLPIQIAVHTGPVLLTREATSTQYSASGQPINMASRLEQIAESGSILISQDTYNQVRGVFLVEGLEPVRFRGSKDLTHVYRVKGIKSRAFRRLHPSIEGVETKTIGREAELIQLTDMMETVMEDQETQVITILGEAGVGKTRLVYELREWEEKLPVDFWFFPGNATPQTVQQPYAFIRDVFAYRFQIQDSDNLLAVQSKFEAGIAQFMGEDSQEAAHVIAYLLGFHLPESPYIKGSSAQLLHTHAVQFIIKFFRLVAHNQLGNANNAMTGLWLHLENIHWADDRSLDLINQLITENNAAPMAVTCTARPFLYERRPTWGSGQTFHTRLDLRPLSRQNSRKLIREILQKVEKIPDELRDLIVERAEGNPFYMEELVKTLVDDRVIIKGEQNWAVENERLARVRVPPTLTGLLQARLDSLLPEERITLQRAAVVGRVFWDTAVLNLQAADRMNVDVMTTLNRLVRHELISVREETSFNGIREYIFKSTMMREVTYESILSRQQRLYHHLVASWLNQTSGQRVHEFARIIAEHYELAGDNPQAADCLYQAAEFASQSGAYAEAVSFIDHGLTLLEGLEDISAKRVRAALHYQWGSIALNRGYYREAEKHLRVSSALAREIGENRRLIEASVLLANVLHEQERMAESEALLKENLALAQDQGDHFGITNTLLWLGANKLHDTNRYADANNDLQEALSLAREHQFLTIEARALNILGELNRTHGNHIDASHYYQAAMQIYRQLNDPFRIAVVTLNLGHVNRLLGEFENALSLYSDALQIGVDIGAVAGLSPEILAGMAGVYAQQGVAEPALHLLGMVLNLPELDIEARRIAESVKAYFSDQLPAKKVKAELAHGASLDLEKTVQEILNPPD